MGACGSKKAKDFDDMTKDAIPMQNRAVGRNETTTEESSVANHFKAKKYQSDVFNDKPALVDGLVHSGSSLHEFFEKYDARGGMVLGSGACGTVKAVRHRTTGELFAMKTISLDSMGADSLDELRDEIRLQKRLDHPNICKVIESFEDRHKGMMYIIMELCTGGPLVARMKTHRHGYSEWLAATFIEKLLSAVIYCHHHGVIHRDIKLDNMIFEDEDEEAELKLIDFGFACEVKRGREGMWEQLGTPSYMAPELWSSYEVEYDSSVDVWAIGVVAYMLLSGRRPWDHPDKREKKRMIQHDPLEFPDAQWGGTSKEAKDFCKALLRKRPSERLSAADAAKHPWIVHHSHSGSHDGVDAAHFLDSHEELLHRLEAFAAADGMAKVALQVIAFSTAPSKLEEMRTLFQKMDTDDSGTLSLSEFKEAMRTHAEISEHTVEKMFAHIDVAHKGEIDYTEFLAATLPSSAIEEHDGASILDAFNQLDTDHDGFISESDLHRAFGGGLDHETMRCILSHACPTTRKVNYAAFQRSIFAMLRDEETMDAAGLLAKITTPPLVKCGKRPPCTFPAPAPA